MKLKVVNVENGDYNKAIKTALIIGAISYGKIYELLHKQLWRKAPSRIHRYKIDELSMFNGRPVEFVRLWNIKSSSRLPYSREGDVTTFGLNQLFMGQDYRKEYKGNPKDGIYHDDCYISPRMSIVGNEDYFDCWAVYNGVDANGKFIVNERYYKQNETGKTVIKYVTYETYTKDGKLNRRVTITHCDPITLVTTNIEVVELGEYNDVKPLVEGVLYGKCNSKKGYFGYKKWRDEAQNEFSNHGAIIKEIETDDYFSLLLKSREKGWIRLYQDGTVVEYIPASMNSTDSVEYEHPSAYKILPMIYTDDGNLAMDRVEFVESWNNYFELIVHEDGEWWQSFIKPIAVIIIAVIAYYTGVNASPVFQAIIYAGAAISAVGILAGDQKMMNIGSLLGIVGALGSAIQEGAKEAVAKEAMEQGFSSRTAAQVGNEYIKDSTFTQVFGKFTSGAGFYNWVKIGSGAFSLYNQAQAIGMNNVSSVENAIEESGMRATIRNEDEEDEVMRVIRI